MDGAILLWIQEYIRNPVLDPVMKTVTHLGDSGAIWILITIALLIPRKTRKAAICSAFALLLMLLLNNLLLKNLFARVRPYDVVEGLELIIERQVDFSFPSGHTAAAFASACVYFRMLDRRAGIPLVILAVMIALTRLYVGVHYPTDVLGGLVLGILCAFIGMWIGNRVWGCVRDLRRLITGEEQ